MTTIPLTPFLASGDPVAASTLRQGQTQIAALTLRSFAGMTIHPVSAQWALETFGEQVTMPAIAYADWPTDDADTGPQALTTFLPIQPGDSLVLGGVTYPIRGVKSRPGIMVTLMVQLKPGQ